MAHVFSAQTYIIDVIRRSILMPLLILAPRLIRANKGDYKTVKEQLFDDRNAKRLGRSFVMYCEEISYERKKQDRKWGGADHDDEHGVKDWATFIDERCYELQNDETPPKRIRQLFIEIAALAVAGVQSYDRRCDDHGVDNMPDGD